MPVTIDRHWRATARRSFELPLPAARVWAVMRDFRRFVCIDPLHQHARFTTPGNYDAPAGRAIVVEHRLLGLGPDRVGRVLRWNEGRGYAFSDLSLRGRRVGFPHVCWYRLDDLGPGLYRITVGARGVWTARWLPRWAGRAWLWWVLAATEGHITAHFARLAWRERPRAAPPPPA